MINNFTIKTVQVRTGSTGEFNINPLTDPGYNMLATAYLDSNVGVFAGVYELPSPLTTVNYQFNNLLGSGLSLSDISTSYGTRLHGLNTFIAKDSLGVAIADADVNVLVVIWND